ncbi:MAG: hypothetical protein LKE55_09425 [Prevotella sp.]|jgi:hypothetical protein|nr:hypothetical protein [Prevotella sp.]
MENAKLNFCDVRSKCIKVFPSPFVLIAPVVDICSDRPVRAIESECSRPAIEAIEKQTSYSVDYTGNLLNHEKLITVRKGSNSGKICDEDRL